MNGRKNDQAGSGHADADESAYPQDDLWPLKGQVQPEDVSPEEARALAQKSRFADSTESSNAARGAAAQAPDEQTSSEQTTAERGSSEQTPGTQNSESGTDERATE